MIELHENPNIRPCGDASKKIIKKTRPFSGQVWVTKTQTLGGSPATPIAMAFRWWKKPPFSFFSVFLIPTTTTNTISIGSLPSRPSPAPLSLSFNCFDAIVFLPISDVFCSSPRRCWGGGLPVFLCRVFDRHCQRHSNAGEIWGFLVVIGFLLTRFWLYIVQLMIAIECFFGFCWFHVRLGFVVDDCCFWVVLIVHSVKDWG